MRDGTDTVGADGGADPAVREILRIDTPMGTDASYIYYKCGCEAIGVGNSGRIYTKNCKVGHTE